MSQEPSHGEADDFYEAARAAGTARARALKAQAAEGGLHFRAYLPPSMATWLLDQIAAGVFTDPSEAVFVMLGEQQELEPHADLRKELLDRTLHATMDDPGPLLSGEEVFENLRVKFAAPRPEPAVWEVGMTPATGA